MRVNPISILVAAAIWVAGCGKEAPVELGRIEPAVTCTGLPAPPAQGIDVSHWQGTINWPQVAGAGISFAIAAVGDGCSGNSCGCGALFLDPNFSTNWAGIKAVGMVRGAYWFFRFGVDPTVQANAVISAVGMLGNGDLPVTIDLEGQGVECGSALSQGQRNAIVHTFMNAVQAGTGKAPMVYTGSGFWNAYVNTADFAGNPLWDAYWCFCFCVDCCPGLPNGWGAWKFWQWTDRAMVPGISGNVDGDEFWGTTSDLIAFAGVPSPSWGAQLVTQSTAGTVTMTAGQSLPAYFEMKNIGTMSWDSNTKIGTTQPHDRASVFVASDWLSSNRLSAVSGTIAPGASYRFPFTFQAPMAPGTYTESFGMVQEGVAWFSDPGQGGPADGVLYAKIVVQPATATDLGTATTADLGTATTADLAPMPDLGAAVDSAGSDAVPVAPDGGPIAQPKGCSCRVGAESADSNRAPALLLFALAALLLARRRLRPRG